MPNPHHAASGHDLRKRRTATALLTAAEELFSERDIRAVTVEEIAVRAGVSVGSVYGHFGSKEGLYLRVVEGALRLSDHYTRNRVWSDSPLQRVLNTGHAYVEFALDHPGAFRMVAAQLPEFSELADLADTQTRIATRIRGEVARVTNDLRAAIASGELQPLPVEHMLAYLWASWSGLIGLALREDRFRISPDDVRAVLDCAAVVLARDAGASAPGLGLQTVDG